MKFSTALLLCGLVAFPVALTRAQETPTIAGYVTRVASGSDFDVNGFRILCGGNTLTLVLTNAQQIPTTQGCPQTSPYVGEVVNVYGAISKKKHAVVASRIEFPLPVRVVISGSAVIEALKKSDSAGSQPANLLSRADGFWIRIDGKTELNLAPSPGSLADVKPGDWIEYKGKQGADGVITAATVKIVRNALGKGEKRFREKQDFDPTAVPASAKQGRASLAFKGIDPKRFPPYNDAAMQARVNEIGEKLIPGFERDLPDSDPAKINFRFQVIDTKWFRDALTLPSGIILIPRQVVERMQNNSQLATVLADNIACALERQTYRDLPASHALVAGEIGADVVGAIVPGVSLVAPALGYGGGKEMQTKAEEQSGRVSLGLLHDAGYDIDEAPMSWWLLAPKDPKPIAKIAMPPRAIYLYRILGETWHNPAAKAVP